MTDWDIMFLGSLFPKGHEEEILQNSITGVQNASNVLQQGLVTGLEANCPGQVRILNSLHIGSYPRHYKKPIIKTYGFSQTSGGHDLNAGFINIKGIKHSNRFNALRPHVRKWALEKSDRKKAMIAYAASATFTKLLLYAKRLNPEISTCLVVADLPEHMSDSKGRSIFFKLFVESENKRVWYDIKHIDSFVLLTGLMAEAMQINAPFAVVEGIASDPFGCAKDATDAVKTTDAAGATDAVENNDIKTILYTGSLTEKYGILDLLGAFEKLAGETYRLIICGEGEAGALVKGACERDSRIEFKGLVRRDEALRLQRSATILINPRPNNEEFTKYSFPSKLIEYMASGTPVAAYLLDGMPPEYGRYLYPIPELDDGAEAIYKTLKHMLELSGKELSMMGAEARKFVLSEKNAVVQAQKIVSLLRALDSAPHTDKLRVDAQ